MRQLKLQLLPLPVA